MKPIEKIVIDANALLSIVIGGTGAKRILLHPHAPKFFVVREAFHEVEEYIPVLARRKSLNEEVLWSIWNTVPIEVEVAPVDTPTWQEAWECLHERDQDDVPTLALALFYRIPIWSQDNDFDEAREICTILRTGELLRILNESER